MDTKTSDLMIGMLRCVLTGTPYGKVGLTDEEEKKLYKLSKAHDLAHLIGYTMKKSGVQAAGEAGAKFAQQYDAAVFRHARRSISTAQLRGLLKEAQIPFILLKGAVLIGLYPEEWMRTSSDIDVLVKPEDLERAKGVLEGEGYRFMCATAHDVSYISPAGTHIELHHTLLEEYRRPATAAVLGRVWSYADPVKEGESEYVMRDEMFYYYHVAHMVKHFETGGCGVRSFMDLWLLDRAGKDSKDKRDELLAEGGILTFTESARRLSAAWFDGETKDPALDDFEEFVLRGGVYGTVAQGVTVRKSKTGKKGMRYRLSRLFLPKEQMKGKYPVLQKHPILLPVCYLRRLFSLLDPKKRKRAMSEIKADSGTGEKDEIRTRALMDRLGI